MTNTILSFNNIKKKYDNNNVILNGVNLSINAGSAVALVGASGCGKSSLLHIAGLLDSASDGCVEINGINASKLSESKRTQLRLNSIGFIYQFHNLMAEFSVWENIAYSMWVKGISKKESKIRALELLNDVGLNEKSDAMPGTLSGGEAQRVAIARSLANDPCLILADEPTGNLDDNNSEKIWKLLLDIVKKRGVAMLCVTHDMLLASNADYVYTLHNQVVNKKIASKGKI